MDFFIFVLIVMMAVGAFFVLYSAFCRNRDDNAAADTTADFGFASLEERLNSLEATVTEADEAAASLDDMTKNAFKEFDDKYQTLLFLYNMIDDKQKTMAQREINAAIAPVQQLRPSADPLAELVTRRKSASNPKYDIVFKMQADGKTPDEIAKELGMGKGQVALILNLGGAADV